MVAVSFYTLRLTHLTEATFPETSSKSLTEKKYQSQQIFHAARKVSKYGVFSGPYFPVFGLNTGKYGSEKTPYLDNFQAISGYDYGIFYRKICFSRSSNFGTGLFLETSQTFTMGIFCFFCFF